MTTPPEPTPQRSFGIPPTTALDQVQNPLQPSVSQPFNPLPAPTGPFPYRLRLADVVGPLDPQVLAFHCLGDSGGIRDPHPQIDVAGLECDARRDRCSTTVILISRVRSADRSLGRTADWQVIVNSPTAVGTIRR